MKMKLLACLFMLYILRGTCVLVYEDLAHHAPLKFVGCGVLLIVVEVIGLWGYGYLFKEVLRHYWARIRHAYHQLA
jgi:hypothetical protein